ncbi:MAG: hypoxanthine phosphoribosyltransferase [Bacteroidota bacterium]
MPSQILIHGKTFKPFITKEQIEDRIAELGDQLRRDYEGKNPLLIGILNGAFIFMGDLVRKMEFDCEMSFVKLSSYDGMNSTGKTKTMIGLNQDIKGREVIVIEDIVDTGNTMFDLLNELHEKGVATARIVTLLFKKDAFIRNFPVHYIGFQIPNKFVVGYGLDYNQHGRNWDAIYQLAE